MTLKGAKQRDLILTALTTDIPPLYNGRHINKIASITGITRVDLIVYMELMERDGYVKEVDTNPRPLDTWIATPKGKIFMIEEGGYTGSYLSASAASSYAKKVELLMTAGTVVAAVATSLIFAWTVWTYFHPSIHR